VGRPTHAAPGARLATGLVLGRAALGTAELLLPRAMARRGGARPPIDGRATAVIRVLGARQIAQALTTYFEPAAPMAATGAVVDGMHALSMVALAMGSTRWRRPAWAEVISATALAGGGVALARCLAGSPASGPWRLRRDH
jgi:hypothetical protein